MDIVKELVNSLNGEYESEGVKKGHTTSGAFISHNSYGLVKKEEYSIKIYNFSNMGVRAVNTLDGSPFKIVLIIPFALKNAQTIFPKSFFQKLLPDSRPKVTLSPQAKDLLKKYSLNGNKELTRYILKDSNLAATITNHKVYIATNIQGNQSTLSLRPNESATTKDHLKVLYDIMDSIGIIIIKNKYTLAK